MKRTKPPSTSTTNASSLATATPTRIENKAAFTIVPWGIEAKNPSSYTLQYKPSNDQRHTYFTAISYW